MLVEYLPSLEYPPISVCIPLSCLSPYSPVQPRPDYPLLFCREQAGCVGWLLLAGQFSAARSGPFRPVPPSYSRFGLVFARGPVGRGLIGIRSLCAAIWLVGPFGVLTGVCCWGGLG
jgi:hypothetical protein